MPTIKILDCYVSGVLMTSVPTSFYLLCLKLFPASVTQLVLPRMTWGRKTLHIYGEGNLLLGAYATISAVNAR